MGLPSASIHPLQRERWPQLLLWLDSLALHTHLLVYVLHLGGRPWLKELNVYRASTAGRRRAGRGVKHRQETAPERGVPPGDSSDNKLHVKAEDTALANQALVV